jgi:hypothetical protein
MLEIAIHHETGAVLNKVTCRLCVTGPNRKCRNGFRTDESDDSLRQGISR